MGGEKGQNIYARAFYTAPPYFQKIYILNGNLKRIGGKNMTETSRPLDALNKARNRKVIVELKNGKQFIGTLNAFDIHINIVLDHAEEREGGEIRRKMNTIFIRGDTIIMISPE